MMAVKTHFTAKDFETILAQYNLGDFVAFKPFKQGQDQTNLLLTTTKNKVVLRYYEKRTVDYAQFEIELLHYLAKHAYPCAGPFANKNGEYLGVYNDKPFALFEFLQGEHSDNSENYLQVAEVIGQLHIITNGYKPTVVSTRQAYDAEYIWGWAQESAKKIPSRPEAQERLAWMRHELDSLELPSSMPKGVCHGDTNPTNFLYQDGKLSGVLDFDQATYTWLLFDVAELIYWWTWPDRGEINFEQTAALITAYEKARPLTDEERHHLFDALKLVILIGMGWFLHHDEDYKNHVRKVALLNEIGRDGFMSGCLGIR